MRLPAGVRTQRIGRATIAALASHLDFVADVIRRYGTLRAWAAAVHEKTFTGRGEAYLVEGADGPWVVRPARRGGAVASVLGDRYVRIGAARPFREMSTSASARERGVATPEVVCCAVYDGGLFYRADVTTRYIRDGIDLATLSLGPATEAEAKRIEAWRAAGRLVRDAAAAGLLHPDLNLRNVLITQSADGVRAHVLDLDRSVVRTRPRPRDAERMTDRLHRSRRKLEAAAGESVGVAALDAFEGALSG